MNKRGDFIKKIMEIDEEAGMLVASDRFLLSVEKATIESKLYGDAFIDLLDFKFDETNLMRLFVWKDSPQGQEYWSNIYWKFFFKEKEEKIQQNRGIS